MQTKIDHIVIGATDLAQGVAYIKETLGIDIPYGGVHDKMGTHNHLMQLGNNIFLEVIAINPGGEPLGHPRWYGLDDPFIRQQLQVQPALLTWVVNTNNINKFLLNAGISFGKAALIHRNNLSWYFGVPDDGRLLASGILPYAIEWQTNLHPSINMADTGCRFQGLEIYHPNPSWLNSILHSIGAQDLVTIHPLPKDSTPYLAVSINTSKGIKILRSLGYRA